MKLIIHEANNIPIGETPKPEDWKNVRISNSFQFLKYKDNNTDSIESWFGKPKSGFLNLDIIQKLLFPIHVRVRSLTN